MGEPLTHEEYVELLFKAALNPDTPSLAAIDEVIKLVEVAIKRLEEEIEEKGD